MNHSLMANLILDRRKEVCHLKACLGVSQILALTAETKQTICTITNTHSNPALHFYSGPLTNLPQHTYSILSLIY